ncbi:MAG: hypothetical protein SFT81_03880 [Candidatus Caenarcaniphilales bacterium]|nr:hypothetical protein [Candidatus Caenarcaniphilales bacterium]
MSSKSQSLTVEAVRQRIRDANNLLHGIKLHHGADSTVSHRTTVKHERKLNRLNKLKGLLESRNSGETHIKSSSPAQTHSASPAETVVPRPSVEDLARQRLQASRQRNSGKLPENYRSHLVANPLSTGTTPTSETMPAVTPETAPSITPEAPPVPVSPAVAANHTEPVKSRPVPVPSAVPNSDLLQPADGKFESSMTMQAAKASAPDQVQAEPAPVTQPTKSVHTESPTTTPVNAAQNNQPVWIQNVMGWFKQGLEMLTRFIANNGPKAQASAAAA